MAIEDRNFHRLIKDFRPWAAREKRYEVAVATTVTTANGTSPAVVVNISNSGCRIRTDGPLSAGERLRLVLEPLGIVDVEVRWTDGHDAGLKVLCRDAFYSDYRMSYLP